MLPRLDKAIKLHENQAGLHGTQAIQVARSSMDSSKSIGRTLSVLALFFSSLVSADVLEDVLERGTIRFGVAEFAPWTIMSESGDLIGFEIDVANKIAQDMGLKPEFKVYEWDSIIPALQRGEIDVLAGGMSITPGRALQVNFSRPLAQAGVGLATNTRMTQNIKTLEELNDPQIVIATVNETLAFSVSQTLFNRANVKTYPSADLAENEIIEGRAHAYLATTTETRFLALRHSDDIDLPITEPLLASREALAVKKGEHELLHSLNAWVTARQADKWVATTRDYWFETLDWARKANN